MTKLTVYFKNNIINTIALNDNQVIHIGSDDTNDLVIDSPAIASAHAVVAMREGSCLIKQLNDKFPLIINGQNTKSSRLYDGDTIAIGQHNVVYTSDNKEQAPSKRTSYIAHAANYQVISGANLGKIFTLKPTMTMLGEPGNGIVAISKRKEGYFVSILENADNILLNKQPLLDKTVKLNNNDVLSIGHIAVQFYLE